MPETQTTPAQPARFTIRQRLEQEIKYSEEKLGKAINALQELDRNPKLESQLENLRDFFYF